MLAVLESVNVSRRGDPGHKVTVLRRRGGIVILSGLLSWSGRGPDYQPHPSNCLDRLAGSVQHGHAAAGDEGAPLCRLNLALSLISRARIGVGVEMMVRVRVRVKVVRLR